MQSCSGIPNVWVGVVSLMALIVLMVDSPKGRGKFIPIEASRGPGLKLLLICPRSQPVDKGFGSALDMALQSSFLLILGSSAFPIVDLKFLGQLRIGQIRCQRPCSGKFACLGNHPSLATRKISIVEVVRARCQKSSTAISKRQELQLWDMDQAPWSKAGPQSSLCSAKN